MALGLLSIQHEALVLSVGVLSNLALSLKCSSLGTATDGSRSALHRHDHVLAPSASLARVVDHHRRSRLVGEAS